MHSVHNNHENNAQIDGYIRITYLHVYACVCVNEWMCVRLRFSYRTT